MKLSLFHAPYVDEDGRGRMRLSGLLTGADPEADQELIKDVKAALVKCANETTLLVVADEIEVGWL